MRNARELDPDPLNALPSEPLLAPAARTWLSWVALSILVAVPVSIGANVVFPNIEAGVILFGAGMGYSAATPWVLRRLGRLVR